MLTQERIWFVLRLFFILFLLGIISVLVILIMRIKKRTKNSKTEKNNKSLDEISGESILNSEQERELLNTTVESSSRGSDSGRQRGSTSLQD